ncbi:MBL fold metallo-hydrolase [Streptomyces sp. NPDC048527]|uniref:MBL fold metallo-hydrolase n=1 Tax=Streptomyces sp. NPDC048527 TaxID=3365568 RepID=UPI0037137382
MRGDVLGGAVQAHVARDHGVEVVLEQVVHRGVVRGDVWGEDQTEERGVLDGEAVDRRQDPAVREVDEQVARPVPVPWVIEDEPLAVDTQFGARAGEGLVRQRPVLETAKGVVVVDAPPDLGPGLPAAIKEATSKPITHLIYSHAHADHIGSADLLVRDGVKVLAHGLTARFVKESDDPRSLPLSSAVRVRGACGGSVDLFGDPGRCEPGPDRRVAGP